MKKKKKKGAASIYKSSVTGEIVSAQFAKENPDTTFRERIGTKKPVNLNRLRTDSD
jgi:hypothetical protein